MRIVRAARADRAPARSLWATAVCCVLAAVAAAQGAGSGTTAAGANAAQRETDQIIKFFQWQVSRDPDNFANYDRLGVAYTRKARETGDITYYELAEKALERSLALESQHREAEGAYTHLATVYFAEHRFEDSLRCARKALAFRTGDLSQYAVIGDDLLELGEYDQAAAAYAHLRESVGPGLSKHKLAYLDETRSASLDFIRGDSAGAIAQMKHAVEVARDQGLPAESVAWTQFMLGEEYFQTGDLDHAAKAYADSLATFPGYHRASAGLAKVRAAQGRFDDAIELYRAAMNVIPMPAYAAALGDVYRRAGNREQAEKQYRLVEYIARLNDINRVVYNRELAMFYADHDLRLDQALELARRELQIRRDVYTWDALAFALYKNGRFDEAARADRNALRMGTRDALLFYHAGMIQARLNDRERAQHYLVLALRTNAQFHVFYADDARRMLREFAERPPVEKSAAGRAGASDS